MALVSILVAVQAVAPGSPSGTKAAGIPASGYAVTDFATGFGTFSGVGPGPIGVAFDAQGNLYSTSYFGGNLYRFPPTGGTFETSMVSHLGDRVTGLAFDKTGRLFVARQGDGDVLQLDPVTGASLGTVASGVCNPNAVAVDPLTNDLFISSCGTVQRLSGYQGQAVSPQLYTANVAVDGLTFAPDGTLYGTGGGPVYRITSTSDAVPGTATQIAFVPRGDGIALVAPAPGQPITQLAVNTNNSYSFATDGEIDLVDFSVSPATVTPIVTGGSRGDFVGVGPDKCLYATQSDEIEKVTAANGTCPFLPTGVAGRRLEFCPQQGQMLNPVKHLDWDKWSLDYGISACEGLVVSNVKLGSRDMAERMSVPYIDLVTCTSQSTVAACGTKVTRHVRLQSSVQPQEDPSAYTQVELFSGPNAGSLPSPLDAPCKGLPACNKAIVNAIYRIDLAPPQGNSPPATYAYVYQQYEFYADFKTDRNNELVRSLSCEPSEFAPLIGNTAIISPLADCARWKPLVSYTFVDNTNSTLLFSFNATTRLHFTPDAVADRSSTFIRDCDNSAPQHGCFPGNPVNTLFETYGPDAPETSVKQEVAIRALVAERGGTATLPGRYDNVHQTPSHTVATPFPLPPGCPECVHIHWRWGANVPGAPPFYGSGQPLIGNADPAAQPNPLSHQQLDVAMVPYHSEQLAPNNYLLLLNGALESELFLTHDTDRYFGGITKGSETLSYPPLTCSDSNHLASWGQCGEVLYMSATTYTVGAHDEDRDDLFAFGGFFCATCTNSEYGPIAATLAPTFNADGHAMPQMNISRGSVLGVSFSGVTGSVQVNDVLPAGLTNVSGQWHALPPIANPGGPPGGPCQVTTDVDLHPVVTCLATTPASFPVDIVISGTVGSSMSPGDYSNTVHAVWGSTSGNPDGGGNFKSSDTIHIT